MNIFHLHRCSYLSALYHCDQHVRKMIMEYCQLMSSAHRLKHGTPTRVIYPNNRVQLIYLLPNETYFFTEEMSKFGVIKYRIHPSSGLLIQTHLGHPCFLWVIKEVMHYKYLLKLAYHISNEYVFRFDKPHAYHDLIRNQLTKLPFDNLETKYTKEQLSKNNFINLAPQCMPIEIKDRYDIITAYRLFYILNKSEFATWRRRDEPEWYRNHRI